MYVSKEKLYGMAPAKSQDDIDIEQADNQATGETAQKRYDLSLAQAQALWQQESTGEVDYTESNLSDMTVKIGSFDTGIEYNAKVAAAAVGFGDLIGDTARGIQQIITQSGAANLIDEEVQDKNEQILRDLYDHPEYGLWSKGGAVAGALAEPVGLLIPAVKFKHAYNAAMYGAVVGGLYGGSSYIDKQESRMSQAALGAVLGGGAGALVHRFFRQEVGGKVDDAIEELDNIRTGSNIRTGKNIRTGESKVVGSKVKGKAPRANDPVEVMKDLEARAAMRGPRHSTLTKARVLVDQVMQPIYNNVKRYSPTLAAGLRKMDYTQHTMMHRWKEKVKPFEDFLHKIPVEQEEIMHKLLTGGINKETRAMAKKFGGQEAVDSLDAVASVLDEVMDLYKKAGYKVEAMKEYFPRSVKDLEGLRKTEQANLERMLASQQQRLKRPLTVSEQRHAIEHYLTQDRRFSTTSGSLKERSIQTIRDEQLPLYHDPRTALHYYLTTASEDIAKREFFKANGYVPKPGKGLDVTGADIDDSVDTIVQVMKKEVQSLDDQYAVEQLLKSRFSSDIHRTHRFNQAIKNLSYGTTLGNFWSAATQLGDLVFAMHKYGIKSTVASIFGKNITTKEQMGIEKAMAELERAQKGWTAAVADWAFQWGGFDAVDRFGKNVNLNASLRKNTALARKNPDKFRDKWKNTFGDETDNVILDLVSGKPKSHYDLSDNVKLMLWNDLADTQPIGLSELPKKYLDMPNGRILYAYKTFTLKQLNYMRDTLLNQPNKNVTQRAADLTYFASLFVAANTGVDTFKGFMSGENLDVEDKFVDNLVGVFGTSKYAVDKSKGLGSIIAQGIAPVPLTQGVAIADNVSQAFTQGKWEELGEKALGQVPVAGKVYREDVITNWTNR